MKPCPKCQSSVAKRVRRPLLLKLIPGSRRYKCSKCKSFYTWFAMLDVGIQL